MLAKTIKTSVLGRTVYPDRRKGLLYVYQSEDSLMHFCWQDRTSGEFSLVKIDIFEQQSRCVKNVICR